MANHKLLQCNNKLLQFELLSDLGSTDVTSPT